MEGRYIVSFRKLKEFCKYVSRNKLVRNPTTGKPFIKKFDICTVDAGKNLTYKCRNETCRLLKGNMPLKIGENYERVRRHKIADLR